MKKTNEELFKEREKRVNDAIALRKPDRVPVTALIGLFPPKYVGMTIEEFMYNPEKTWEAYWKTMLEFEPDLQHNPFPVHYIGPMMESLDFKQMLWAGHGVGPDVSYQFVEGEYMEPVEYDHFLHDPTDFMMRKYWPRVFGALKGFEKLPPLHNIITYTLGAPFDLISFTLPEVTAAFESLKKAGEDALRIASYSRRFIDEAGKAGYPIQSGSFTQAPFDLFGDYFRGMKGAMLDMYRRPDKLIAACEKMLPVVLEMAINGAKASGVPRVFIPLHKGLDGFMSLEQFKKFFWPTLRELMIGIIDAGLVPCPFWEGDCTSRLEIIRDIPAGKAMYIFESTDLVKAKEVLGDTVCIRGGLPISTLVMGTPDDVRAQCKKLIDVVGRDGGYIMDGASGFDDAKPENVRAMFEFVKEYGVY